MLSVSWDVDPGSRRNVFLPQKTYQLIYTLDLFTLNLGYCTLVISSLKHVMISCVSLGSVMLHSIGKVLSDLADDENASFSKLNIFFPAVFSLAGAERWFGG